MARIGNLDTAATHRGVRVLSAGPTSLAFVRDDVLAVGTAAAVRGAIDRAQGEGDALAGAPLYERATADRPGGRTLDLYASAQGVREVLAARDGLLGTAGTLLDREGLEAAAASLAAEEDGLRVAARLAGGGSEDASFTPVLVERVPEAAVAYLGVKTVSRLIRVLGRLGGRPDRRRGAPGARRQRRRRPRRRPRRAALGRGRARRDDRRGGPRRLQRRRARGDAEGADRGRGGDGGGARAAAGPARHAARPARERARVPAARRSAACARSRSASRPSSRPPTRSRRRASCSPRPPPGSLRRSGRSPPHPRSARPSGRCRSEVDSLLFLDLRQLLALGEQTGLTAIPGLGTARDDLARVQAAGLTVAQDPARKTDTTAELFLEIP